MMFLSMSYCLSWGTLLSSSTPCPPTNAYELCRKQSKVTFSGKFSLPTNHYSPSLYIIVWRKDRLPTPVFLGFPHGSDGKVGKNFAKCFSWHNKGHQISSLQHFLAPYCTNSWPIPLVSGFYLIAAYLQHQFLNKSGHNQVAITENL